MSELTVRVPDIVPGSVGVKFSGECYAGAGRQRLWKDRYVAETKPLSGDVDRTHGAHWRYPNSEPEG